MITLDSPIATVLGDKSNKRKRFTDGLGIATVGDLLGHFPRRYIKTGELTTVADLQPGQMLTVVGEIAESDVRTYNDRRTGRTAYRIETLLRTDGPSLRMTFFAKQKRIAEWHHNRLAVGKRGVFTGQVSRFRTDWQLTNPKMVIFGETGDDEATRAALESIGALYPIYPLTKGVDSWDLQRAISFARTVLDDVPELLPESLRDRYDLIGARTAYDWIHAPDDHGQVTAAQRRFRFEEALVTQLVLAAATAGAARARSAGANRRPGRSAGRVRRPAAVRADHRPARDRRRARGGPRPPAPDEPAAPGRGRLRQDPGGGARHAPHRRLRWPGRAAGADRSAGPAAPPVDHRLCSATSPPAACSAAPPTAPRWPCSPAR